TPFNALYSSPPNGTKPEMVSINQTRNDAVNSSPKFAFNKFHESARHSIGWILGFLARIWAAHSSALTGGIGIPAGGTAEPICVRNASASSGKEARVCHPVLLLPS